MSKKTFVKVVGIGLFDINLNLTLTEDEAKKFNVPELSEINSLTDCKSFLIDNSEKNNQDETAKKIPTIFDYFVITTNNSTINTLLFINKAFKNKTFIEYLILSEPVFKEEEKFLYDVIKNVTEQNYLFVLENRILKIPMKFNFTFNVGKETKSFELVAEGAEVEPKNENNLDLYEKLNYEFDDTNYFYSNLNEIFQITKYKFNLNDFSQFLNSLILKNPKIEIVLNFPEIIQNLYSLNFNTLNIISEIILYTDIFIFDKRESLSLFSLLLQLNSGDYLKSKHSDEDIQNIEIIFIRDVKKLRVNVPKIGLFFDEFKKFTIIEMHPKSEVVVFHSDFEFDLIPKHITNNIQEEYRKLLASNYSTLKYIFLGGFFSRLFHGKSFITCFKAGNEIIKRILELLKLNFELPSDPNFYLITIKKSATKSKKKEEEENKIKERERHFMLDCINIETSKKKNYNPLYDKNLQSFFSSKEIFKHLKKLGFVDRRGNILQDPDTKKDGVGNNRKLLRSIELEKKKLMSLKETNQIMKRQIKQILDNDTKTLQYPNSEQLEKFLKLENMNLLSEKKVYSNCKSNSQQEDELYAKSLLEKRKEYLLKNSYKNKNLKPISGEKYKKLLESFEKKTSPNQQKESIKPIDESTSKINENNSGKDDSNH
jgi:hypothetical protein